MLADQQDNLLQLRKSRAIYAFAPIVEHVGHDVRLFAVKDLAEPFFVPPRVHRAQWSSLCQESVEGGLFIGRELGVIFQKQPARFLEYRLVPSFFPASLIDRL